MDTETLLTPVAVAQLKGVTRAAVYSAIKRAQLRSEMVLGRRVVQKQAAEEWAPVKEFSKRGKMGGRPKSAAPNPSHPSGQSEQSEQSEGAA